MALPRPDRLEEGSAVPDGWDAAVRETHSAVVLLMGDRAYKIKKPVDLGFLDFSTTELRAAACRRELTLNRRMAPDVYLGVAAVLGPDGTPCEQVLVMRRMPEDRRLSLLVRQGADVSDPLRRLARDLAAFHATARTNAEIAQSGSAAALRRRWRDNLTSIRELAVPSLSSATIDEIEGLALGYVAGRERLFESRIRLGLVRDGHGDLLADDIFCLPDGPRALDCLDFDDHLRWMDVLDDVACLAMDLERLGDPEAGQQLLRQYAEFSGHRQPESLQHHYLAYRAVMRAKIACLRAGERGAEGAPDAEEAALLGSIGLRHLRDGQPRLVLVGGIPASGKSSLANALGDRIPAAVLSSDRVRKELGGVPPGQHVREGFGEGLYAPEATQRTYAWLAARARSLLDLGESVIVDATFSRADLRDAFREQAARSFAPVVELQCTVPRDVVVARLRSRDLRGDSLSDAGTEIGRLLADTFEPWPESSPVDTSGTLDAAVSRALVAFGESAVCVPG